MQDKALELAIASGFVAEARRKEEAKRRFLQAVQSKPDMTLEEAKQAQIDAIQSVYHPQRNRAVRREHYRIREEGTRQRMKPAPIGLAPLVLPKRNNK